MNWRRLRLQGRGGVFRFFGREGETFVLGRSLGRKGKENAILNRFADRFGDKLVKLAERAEPLKSREKQKVKRQIRRLLGRSSRAVSLFSVMVTDKDSGLCIGGKRNEGLCEWALENGGIYLLRPNWKEIDPKVFWNA